MSVPIKNNFKNPNDYMSNKTLEIINNLPNIISIDFDTKLRREAVYKYLMEIDNVIN